MNPSLKSLLVVAISMNFLHGSLARDVPQNLKSFYNTVQAARTCQKILQGGLANTENGPKNVGADQTGAISYCGDHLADSGIIYIKGTKGQLANMDVDCDGNQQGPGNDGRCDPIGDRQSQTAFGDTLAGYQAGVKELNPFVHPYVVFGNDNEQHKPGFVDFQPQKYGIEPLSIMAVVCGNKLIYGVWGDTNGADGSASLVGEGSLALATACFGKGMNADSGHDPADVLYIAFKGMKAVPGSVGVKWNAKSYDEFEASIQGLGDELIGGIQATAGA